MTDQMRKLNVSYTPVVYEETDAAYVAYSDGRCDGIALRKRVKTLTEQNSADANL